MISKLQKPIDSGFNSKSDAREITKGVDLNGKIAIVTGGYSGIGPNARVTTSYNSNFPIQIDTFCYLTSI